MSKDSIITSLKESIKSDKTPENIIKEHGVHHMTEPYTVDQNLSEAKARAMKMAEIAGAMATRMNGISDFSALAMNDKELGLMMRNLDNALREFCDYSGINRYY